MQEEVNQKTIALCTRCAKMTADVLKGLMRKYLSDREKHKQEVKHKKAEKAAQEKAEKNAPVRGKQTLKKLMDRSIEIAPVTPRIFPGPTRIAVDSKNAASAEIPVFVAALL